MRALVLPLRVVSVLFVTAALVVPVVMWAKSWAGMSFSEWFVPVQGGVVGSVVGVVVGCVMWRWASSIEHRFSSLKSAMICGGLNWLNWWSLVLVLCCGILGGLALLCVAAVICHFIGMPGPSLTVATVSLGGYLVVFMVVGLRAWILHRILSQIGSGQRTSHDR